MAQSKMTAKDLVADIALGSGQTETAVRAVLRRLEIEVGGALSRGQIVTIPGIAVLTPRDRPARIGRNPRTGEPTNIPAKRVATARVLPALSKAIA